ncbi:unnamed protein product, partial [Oncorhynchus mykiss]
METPQPGPADGEERSVELRPRTRSNPEGAEDRRSSTGSLGNSNPSTPQPAVGSRVEGEGEASTSDSPPSSTTTTVSATTAQTVAPIAPPPLTPPIPPTAEFQLRAPRVNCPEKVVRDPVLLMTKNGMKSKG